MQHKHTYDEHGLCFECDKPKPKLKAQLMARLRKARREAGLSPYTLWLTPEEKKAVDAVLERLKADTGGK